MRYARESTIPAAYLKFCSGVEFPLYKLKDKTFGTYCVSSHETLSILSPFSVFNERFGWMRFSAYKTTSTKLNKSRQGIFAVMCALLDTFTSTHRRADIANGVRTGQVIIQKVMTVEDFIGIAKAACKDWELMWLNTSPLLEKLIPIGVEVANWFKAWHNALEEAEEDLGKLIQYAPTTFTGTQDDAIKAFMKSWTAPRPDSELVVKHYERSDSASQASDSAGAAQERLKPQLVPDYSLTDELAGRIRDNHNIVGVASITYSLVFNADADQLERTLQFLNLDSYVYVTSVELDKSVGNVVHVTLGAGKIVDGYPAKEGVIKQNLDAVNGRIDEIYNMINQALSFSKTLAERNISLLDSSTK